jgi:hypothetical protein
MAGFCYVTPITGHKDYIGKEEEEDYAFIQTKSDVEAQCEFAASVMKTPDYSLIVTGIV